MTRLRAVLLLLAASASFADLAAAQASPSLRISAIVGGTYRWRGIPRSHGLNSQLEASARLGRRRTTVGAGVWTNVELGLHGKRGLTDLRRDHWGPSETDLWAELAHSFGAGDVAAGIIHYQYRGRAGAMGTSELYARYRGSGQGARGISPELSLWYDVDRRQSGYLEAGATAPVLALPLRGLSFLIYAGAQGGMALGTPKRPLELAASTFAGSCLTSAEVSAGVRLSGEKLLHGALFNLGGHLQYARDDATRRKRLDPPELKRRLRPYITFGLGFRWPPPANR